MVLFRAAWGAPYPSDGEIMTGSEKTSVAAGNFFKRFGATAPAEAKRRAREMHLFDRAEGYVTWMLFLKHVKAPFAYGAEETLH